jgi:hypothetical protein
MVDPFDPNNWQPDTHEYRIYGDDMAQTWAVLDEVDYLWAVRWRWNWSRKRNGLYLRRAITLYEKGQRTTTQTLYLHTEIMKRSDIEPKSSKHCIVDHRNGDTTDNRRLNLRWTNHSQNAKNSHGKHPMEFEHDQNTGDLWGVGNYRPDDVGVTGDLFRTKYIRP